MSAFLACDLFGVRRVKGTIPLSLLTDLTLNDSSCINWHLANLDLQIKSNYKIRKSNIALTSHLAANWKRSATALRTAQFCTSVWECQDIKMISTLRTLDLDWHPLI